MSPEEGRDLIGETTSDAGKRTAKPLIAEPLTADSSSEFKTCPDCAEVRFAARKCRFCGYLFEN